MIIIYEQIELEWWSDKEETTNNEMEEMGNNSLNQLKTND